MFRLHDFINNYNLPSSPITTTPIPTGTPLLNYPDIRFYMGSKGCSNPINNTDFQALVLTIQSQTTDIAKFTTAKALMNTKCLSVEQLMKICLLINNEAYRLDILKSSIANAYDRGNFSYAAQVLSIEPYKNDYTNYCITISTPAPPVNSVPLPVDSFSECRVNATDFNDMKSSIQKLSFSNTKVAQIKSIMNTRCFTVNQIKELISLIDFENGKLDIAKTAYTKCIDKKNYYSVNDAFSFSSSITELNNYINQH